jgi:glycosylphosphatidylinositol transamidase (GPIT) subunit GPI8
MDEIDITDSTFALNSNFNETDGSASSSFSSMYMYIGIAVSILFFCYLFYTNYSKGKKVTFQDKLDNCYGESCGVDKCV